MNLQEKEGWISIIFRRIYRVIKFYFRNEGKSNLVQHTPALSWLTGELVFTSMSEKEVSSAPLCLRVLRELWGPLLFSWFISAYLWKVIKQKHGHGSKKLVVKVCFINWINSCDYKQMCNKFKWNDLFCSNPFLPSMHNILHSSSFWSRAILSRTKIQIDMKR